MNNPQFNDGPDLMLKTSQVLAEVAVRINQESLDCPFQEKGSIL